MLFGLPVFGYLLLWLNYWLQFDYFQGGYIVGSLLSLAVIGAIVWLIGRTLLVVSTSDGKNTVIYSRNRQFLTPIMERIREVMLAGEDAKIVYQVNIMAEKIERLDASETSIVNSPGAVAVGGDVSESQIAAAANAGELHEGRGGFSQAHPRNDVIEQARERARPIARRAQEAAALAQRQVGQVRQAASAVLESYRSAGGDDRRGSVRIDRSPGSVAVGGSVAGSTVSTKVSIVNDYDSIIDLLKRHRVDYLNEIVDYLGPVRDHLAGGATRRADALERWAWFAAQAAGALSGIDGLLGLVERVGRALGR